ncbi:hypothetical protein SAMN05216281_102379 [Cryobacterium luteum]|nr:hypothetical protein SAMN05216281_102379 [Cryobacterium luteum]
MSPRTVAAASASKGALLNPRTALRTIYPCHILGMRMPAWASFTPPGGRDQPLFGIPLGGITLERTGFEE